MTSNKTQHFQIQKILKTVYEFLTPILWIVTVFSGLLCLFRSAENSDSRTTIIIIFVISCLLIAALKVGHKLLENKDEFYRIYQSKAAKKMSPSVVFPLCVMVIIVVLPFYILIVTALKNPMEANHIAFTWWPTEGIDLSSFKEVFTSGSVIGISLAKAAMNSFIYAIIPVTVGLFISALSAYAFAKLEFKGRDAMYQILIMTMMMPGCVTMTTAYIMYEAYGWTNTALPLIVPGCFGGAATVMFLREYFMGIPNGLLEAAKIDGGGKWKNFFLIMLPLAKPALIAQFVLGFVSAYNDFITPLIYLNNPAGYTIQVALDFLNGAIPDQTLIASAGIISLMPMLLLYVVFQKPIINGIAMSSGIKG